MQNIIQNEPLWIIFWGFAELYIFCNLSFKVFPYYVKLNVVENKQQEIKIKVDT